MPRRVRGLRGGAKPVQCLGMMNFTELPSVPSDHLVPFTDQLRLAVAAYLARFKGASRYHTESDLRCYLTWCAEHGLDPLAARRPHLELYIRWMQEIRRFKPSTVSRRFSVTAGFYRTCVIDGLLEHSPAEHVRRPTVPPQSPTLGFTHLQFEALLTAARKSPHPCDFALVAMLGSSACGSSKPPGADIADLGEEHGHRMLRVCGKGTKVALLPLPPAVCRAIDQAIGGRTRGPILLNSRGARRTATPPPADYGTCPKLLVFGSPGHTLICSATPSSRPCSTRAWTCGTSRSLPGTPIRAPRCATTGPQEPRSSPELHPGRLHGLRHLTATVSLCPSPGRRPALPMSVRLLSSHWRALLRETGIADAGPATPYDEARWHPCPCAPPRCTPRA